jgi:hypothetical protein
MARVQFFAPRKFSSAEVFNFTVYRGLRNPSENESVRALSASPGSGFGSLSADPHHPSACHFYVRYCDFYYPENEDMVTKETLTPPMAVTRLGLRLGFVEHSQ